MHMNLKEIFRYVSLLGIHAVDFILKKEIKNKIRERSFQKGLI